MAPAWRQADTGRTLITVAPTGAEAARPTVPQLPTTLDELVETAVPCQAAGAGLIHVHLRDDEHRPTLEPARLRDTVRPRVSHRPDRAAVHRRFGERPVRAPPGRSWTRSRLAQTHPAPSTSATTCSATRSRSWPSSTSGPRRGVLPEFELFELGHVSALHRLLDTYGPPTVGTSMPTSCSACPAGCPAPPPALVAGVAMLPARGHLVGHRHRAQQLPVAAAASMGGHLRVGMEDTLTLAPRRCETTPNWWSAPLLGRTLQRPADVDGRWRQRPAGERRRRH